MVLKDWASWRISGGPYAIGTSGTVQLTSTNGIITITSAVASAGWTVVSTSAPGGWVVVEFLSANQRVAFNAFLVDGVVQVSVDSSSQPGSPVIAHVTQSDTGGVDDHGRVDSDD